MNDPVDPIDVVRSFAPEAEPSDALLARVRSDLMSTITAEPANPATPPSPMTSPKRSKRRWLLPAAAAAVLVTSAGAWAAIRNDGPTNLGISCPANREGSVAGVQATTGDPVADCATTWVELNGGDAPAMTAYVNPDGDVRVVLAGEPAPEGYAPMPDARFDTKLIQLQEALDDISGDLPHGCLTEAEARSFAQQQLDRHGLSDWTVETESKRPIDDDRPCARASILGKEHQVVLRGDRGPSAPPDDPYQQFARTLDEELATSCSTLPDAEAVTERIAAATDVSALTDVPFTTKDGLLHIDSVDDPTATCTTASVTVGGNVQVTLRGPAS